MNLTRQWRGLMILVLALCAALALPAAAQTDPATAERLLRKSGLWAQFEGIAVQVRQGLVEGAQQSGREFSAADAERLQAAASVAYAAERLRSSALRTVAAELETPHLRALLSWYDSATGVLLTRLEERASTDNRPTEALMADGLARLQAMSAERRAHIDALIEAAGSVDAALSMTLNTVAGVRQGLASVLPPGEGPTPEATRALLAEQLPQLRPAYAQLVLAATAVAYGDAVDAQLAAYVDFLRSAPGRHVSVLMQRAIDAAFLDAGSELGRRLAVGGTGA
jgi:hypothetical protein